VRFALVWLLWCGADREQDVEEVVAGVPPFLIERARTEEVRGEGDG
jgi:hypothetical protein